MYWGPILKLSVTFLVKLKSLFQLGGFIDPEESSTNTMSTKSQLSSKKNTNKLKNEQKNFLD